MMYEHNNVQIVVGDPGPSVALSLPTSPRMFSDFDEYQKNHTRVRELEKKKRMSISGISDRVLETDTYPQPRARHP